MTIIRRAAADEPGQRFYTISRDFILDTRLSPTAKLIGVLVANESRPFGVQDFVAHLRVTRANAKTALDELERYGYAELGDDGSLVIGDMLGGGR